MPSFDIESIINLQEADNAIGQAKKELLSRYDLKGTQSDIEWDKKEITLVCNDDQKIAVIKDILQSKMHKRGIDIRALKFDPVKATGGQIKKQKVSLIQGIEKEKGKEIIKFIKEKNSKIQSQINDDKVKVTSKSIDMLQECIGILKGQNFGLPLQFSNFRD